jgi:hypothetical protein
MLRVVATQSPSIVCPSHNAVNRQHCRKFDLLGATHIGFDVDQMRRFAKALSCNVGRSCALALYPATLQDRWARRSFAQSLPRTDHNMRMTKQQFDEAVDLLEQEVWPDDEDECRVRVFTASYFVMRQRLRLPEDEAWVGPSAGELSEFLVGLNEVQRKRLKQIAETLIGGPETIFH